MNDGTLNPKYPEDQARIGPILARVAEIKAAKAAKAAAIAEKQAVVAAEQALEAQLEALLEATKASNREKQLLRVRIEENRETEQYCEAAEARECADVLALRRALEEKEKALEASRAERSTVLGVSRQLVAEAAEQAAATESKRLRLALEVPATAEAGHACVVCFEKWAGDVALRPCGHVCVCDKCRASALAKGLCPICRKRVTETLRTFRVSI
jgi:DNA repair exonuclease SbcCD ATPase subunit